jgi:hypothetical protein
MPKNSKSCNLCKHNHFNGSCEAFDPKPIPFGIISGQIIHTEVLPNQKNLIVFELRDPSVSVSELIKNAKPITVST